MLDWMEYNVDKIDFVFVIYDRVNSIKNVMDSVIIIDTIFVVWLGVRDTKYENITSIPLT